MAVVNYASSTEDRVSGAQVIERSLKFNSRLNARLERTPSTAGNRRVYTISVWCKNTITSSGSHYIFDAKGPTGVNGENPIAFDNGRLRHSFNNGSDIWDRTSEKYFRDTGWYHIVASVDMTLANQDDRVRTFVNNVRITDFTNTSRPSQNYESAINDDSVVHAIGWWINGTSREFDGYLSQFHLIDGSALEPTDFGFQDPLTDTWRPKTFEKSSRIPNRKGRVFSSTVTASGSGFGGSTGPEKAFDGDMSTGFNNGAGGQWITWNTSSYNLSGNLRIYCKSSSGLYDIYVNGNGTKVADTGSSYAWVDCGTHDVINEVQWAGTSYGGNAGLGSAGVHVAAIIVDGVWLRDNMHEYGTNGSFLPFDGSTVLIGHDQSGAGNNWKSKHISSANYPEKATGAFPVLNTINGGRVAAPGVRGYFGSKIVTVASSKFVVDGVSQASLQLLRGGTYKFDQSDSSNTGHPLRFSTTDNGSHGGGSEYTDGRVTNGTPGSAGAYTTITVPHNAANTLYYYCTAHSGMGGDMSVTTDVTKADPHAWKCKLALPLLGQTTDYSNTINCTTTAKAITTVGNSAANYERQNFYSGAYYFDGSSDCIYTADNNDWEPGSGDFCMEMWVRRFRVDADEWLMIQSDGTSAGSGVGIHIWSTQYGGSNHNQFSGRMRIGGSNIDVNGSTKLGINKWYHLAFTREGDKCRVFVDGQLDGELTNGGAIAAPSTPMVVGAVMSSGSSGIKGWIQDVRFYKGVAKYTKDFTPATAHPDLLPETPSGTAYSSELTLPPKGSSIQFDGTTQNLYVANHADMNPGSGDFTVEAWIYVSRHQEDNWASIGGCWNFGSNRRTWTLQIEKSSRQLYFYCSGDGSNSSNATTPNTKISFDRWHHCAGVRKGNTLTVYLDGIAGGTTGSFSGSVLNNTNDPFRIGDSSATGSHNTKGYISNFRFVKGTAVYTDNFEPPTEPLTAITNTKLLCCQDPNDNTGATVEPSALQFNGSGAGEPHLSRFSPFASDLDTISGQETGYASFNQNDSGPLIAVTDGGLEAGFTAGTNHHQCMTVSMVYPSTGKWYCEFTTNATNSDSTGISLVKYDQPDYTVEGNPMANNQHYAYSRGYECRGRKIINGVDQGANTYGTAWNGVGEVISVLVDMTGSVGKLTFWNNGISQGVHTSDLDKTLPYILIPYGYAGAWHSFFANFGQKPFAYTPPEGYKTLNYANLPRPVIPKPQEYFKPVMWTGHAGTDIKVDLGFRPDLVIAKSRTQTYGWYWYDSVRGGDANSGTAPAGDKECYKALWSHVNNAEQNEASTGNGIVLNHKGFIVDKDGQAIGEAGQGSNNMVGYCWKAGGHSNTYNIDGKGYSSWSDTGLTAGDITPTGMSLGTKQGLNIISYTGIGGHPKYLHHHLGAVPGLVIIKNRSYARNWAVKFPQYMAGGQRLELQSTGTYNSEGSGSGGLWNATNPDATRITFSDYHMTNGNGDSMIAYVWIDVEGFSKFGCYDASAANSDHAGPFVYTGFRPAFVMFKNATSTEAWSVIDNTRSELNPVPMLLPSATNTELATSNPVDLLSNGFKIKTNNNPNTGDNHKYHYAAFAESPISTLYGGQSNAR